MGTIGGCLGTKAAENRLKDGAANVRTSVRRYGRRARGLGGRSGSSAVGRAGAGVGDRRERVLSGRNARGRLHWRQLHAAWPADRVVGRAQGGGGRPAAAGERR